MPQYFIKRNLHESTLHQLHVQGCPVFPDPALLLGEFTTLGQAVNYAQSRWGTLSFESCAYCLSASQHGYTDLGE